MQKYVKLRKDMVDAPRHDNIAKHDSPAGGLNLFTHADLQQYRI